MELMMDFEFTKEELALVRTWRIEGFLAGARKAFITWNGTLEDAILRAKVWTPRTPINFVRIVDPFNEDNGLEWWSEQREVQLAA